MVTRLEAHVHGLVHGVFFRHHAQLRAQALNLSGSVENCPDGTVHVIAEGERESVEKLLLWLYQGPELACVERVDVEWGEFTGSYRNFRVLR